jgi:hypothetical protein
MNQFKLKKTLQLNENGFPTAGFHFNNDTKPQNEYEFDPKEVINVLTEAQNGLKYLEIGVDQGATFDNIQNVSIKHGVDPYGSSKNITHRMSSQMFFTMNKYFFKQKYDVIFIDALHLFDVVQHEIQESLKILEDDGLIILHDTCPFSEASQKILLNDFENILNDVISADEKKRLSWHENTQKNQPIGFNGDVWKNVAWWRSNSEYTVFSIPNACISIISKQNLPAFDSNNKLKNLSEEKMNWNLYYNLFQQLMNPVTFSYFKENIEFKRVNNET